MGELADFLERTLDLPAQRIKGKILSAPGEVLARKAYVLDALAELWAPVSIDSLPELTVGELRPLFRAQSSLSPERRYRANFHLKR